MTTSNTPIQTEAVAYIRGGRGSTQEARYRALAKQHNLRVRKVYRDMGVSGNRLDRPELNRLLKDIAARPVGYVIVADQARLGQDVVVCETVRRRIAATGASVLDERPDPAVYFEAQIHLLIDEYTAEAQRARIRAGLLRRKSLLKANGEQPTR